MQDLRESCSLHQERTQYFTHGDRCFGHLPVVGCLPDEDVCQMLSQGHCIFLLVLENTPVQQNVI